MKMETIEVSETSSFGIQTPGNYPKENIIHKDHGESLKSRNNNKDVLLSSKQNTLFFQPFSFSLILFSCCPLKSQLSFKRLKILLLHMA